MHYIYISSLSTSLNYIYDFESFCQMSKKSPDKIPVLYFYILSLSSPPQIFAIFAFSTCGSYSGMFKMSVECKNRSESDLGIEVEFEYPFRYVPCCSTLILLPYVFTVNSKYIHTSSMKIMSTTVYLSFYYISHSHYWKWTYPHLSQIGLCIEAKNPKTKRTACIDIMN